MTDINKIYTAISTCLIVACTSFFSVSAMAQDEKGLNVIFVTENTRTDNYQYAYESRKKTAAIMLFGVTETEHPYNSSVARYTPSLPEFIDQHLKNAKNGLTSKFENEDFDLYAGDTSFFSQNMNRGLSVKSAKLAGLAMDFGDWTFGGGYTWGEENPAFLDDNEEGFIIGTSYHKNDWAVQASYMSTGDIFSFDKDKRYNSYVLGASYAPNQNIGYTATVNFQQYDGDKTYINDQELRFTIGTKIKF